MKRIDEMRRSQVVRATVVVGLAAVGAGIVAVVIHRRAVPEVDASLRRLAEAVQQEPYRHVEARLSISSDYRPFAPQKSRGPAIDAVFLAANDVLRADGNGDRATAASGVAYLIAGSTERSLSILKREVIRRRVASTWSDYAAALLAKSAADDDPLLSIDALAACDEALALEPHQPAAVFNRALALRNLGLMEDEREALLTYLRVDKDSPWANEATRHVRDLEQLQRGAAWPRELRVLAASPPTAATVERLVRQYPQQTRVYAEGVWPAEWAEAVKRGDATRAAATLELAARTAHALRSASGEALAADAIAVVERAAAKQRTAPLVEAYLTYREGRILHSKHNPVAAEPAFRRAEALFAASGSPMEYVARYYSASAIVEQSRLSEAAKLLDELAAAQLQKNGYLALDAQIGWERGATAAMRGAFSDAFEIYGRSRRTLAALGEAELVASIDGLIAGAYEFTGQPLPAWRVRREALQSLFRTGNRARILAVVENAASACVTRHEWRRALALLRVTTTAAEAARNPELAAHALNQQVVAHTLLGNPKAAHDDLQRAQRWIAAIADERQRGRAGADAAFSEGLLLARPDPGAALARFDAAQRFWEAADDHLQLPRCHLQRARIRSRRGDDAAARGELELGLAEFERQRGAIRDLEQRADMFSVADELFDEAIALALRANDNDGAFRLAERQRSRTLLDTFSAGSRAASVSERPPLSVDEIRASIAPDAAVVEYVVGPDALSAFVVRPDGVTRTTTAIDRADVAARVDAFRHAVANADAVGAGQAAARLAAVLVQPIHSHLAGVRQIAFVPDRSLGSLSFAMLPDGGALLVDDYVVLQSPSATLAVECSRRARDRRGNSMLAVAGSVIDRERYGDLPFLEAVEGEARAAARGHDDATVLLGAHATPEAVLRELPRFRIAHFAAHAVSSAQNPLDSRLLLAPGLSGHGELRAGDIAVASLPRTRLVVLAACGAADPKNRRDGVANLAAAFLEAGVPMVVSTLWDTEDQTTSALMKRFHDRLRETDAAEALTSATREILRGERDGGYPVKLGGLTIIGGTPEFVRPGPFPRKNAVYARKERTE